jgi:hypothetical protein
MLSASLTEEEIYGTARDFAQAELQPGIVQATRAGAPYFDRGIMRSFGEMGLLGLTCLQRSMVAQTQAMWRTGCALVRLSRQVP